MDSNFLLSSVIFLTAACVVVPLVNRLKLGSVLGYLAAGIAIGPFGFGLIENNVEIMHFGEFGVVMMLFIIGLELEVSKLWQLRKRIVGLGGIQMALTTMCFTAIGVSLGRPFTSCLAVGMALSLSSTALVLQSLEEKGLRQTEAGESSFAVLLFQDIAVIFILIIMPLLSHHDASTLSHESGVIAHLPGWAHALLTACVIGGMVGFGKYGAPPLFHYIARSNLREVFTALSLLLVIGSTLLMQMIGVSPALGAFIAGVMLASSSYKHTLETDIAPFKGLLLGLFFISVGMGMNFSLLGQYPVSVIGGLTLLMSVKMLVLLIAGGCFSLKGSQNTVFAFALAQGGEFAFVLFQYAAGLDLIGTKHAGFLTLVVALSMALTPFLMMINDRFLIPRFLSLLPEPTYDTIESGDHPVILAGYGRFGQIIGRFLSAQGIKLTILEKDPDQIALLRRFGNKGYFGDATRLDLLEAAGAREAKLLVVAIDNPEQAIDIVTLAKSHFPNLTVFARARNRRHAYELQKAGADLFRRETFDASLWMAAEVMKHLGKRAFDAHYKAKQFMLHDEATLKTSFDFFEHEPELISFSKQARQELERILQEDLHPDEHRHARNEEWGHAEPEEKNT